MDAADMAMVLSLVVVGLGWEVAGDFSGRSLRCAAGDASCFGLGSCAKAWHAHPGSLKSSYNFISTAFHN